MDKGKVPNNMSRGYAILRRSLDKQVSCEEKQEFKLSKSSKVKRRIDFSPRRENVHKWLSKHCKPTAVSFGNVSKTALSHLANSDEPSASPTELSAEDVTNYESVPPVSFLPSTFHMADPLSVVEIPNVQSGTPDAPSAAPTVLSAEYIANYESVPPVSFLPSTFHTADELSVVEVQNVQPVSGTCNVPSILAISNSCSVTDISNIPSASGIYDQWMSDISSDPMVSNFDTAHSVQ